MRHGVYALELRQHAPSTDEVLRDSLDEFNEYVLACVGDEIAGFVSITPPGHGRYSIDKYLSRSDLPFPVDEHLYEVRLLTVPDAYRSGPVTPLLMHAALRWIDERGGRQIVAMGRREVLSLYEKAGFRPLGRSIRSGAVHYELIGTDIQRARDYAGRHGAMIRRLQGLLDWQLGFPLFRPEPCEHGGAFFQAIGEDFRTLRRRSEIINADVLDAWFPPAPRVLQLLRDHLDWAVRTSPPTHCAGLVATIAAVRGIPAGSVVPGGGSSALIYLALREWLDASSRVLLLDPTYGEYGHVLEQVIGCRPDLLRLARRTDYAVDLDQLEHACRREYDLIVLVNPNNPTGRHIPRAALQSILQRAPSRTRFWIDEAYIDYVGSDESLERFAAQSESVVVCKSLSKAYALSGLRAAYLSAPPRLAAALRRVTPPWSIGLPGQMAAVSALQSAGYYRGRYEETHRLRGELAAALERLGIAVVPGTANFLLCHLPEEGPEAAALLSACREEGLFLPDVRSMGSELGPYAFRIAVKDSRTNGRALAVFGRRLRQVPSTLDGRDRERAR